MQSLSFHFSVTIDTVKKKCHFHALKICQLDQTGRRDNARVVLNSNHQNRLELFEIFFFFFQLTLLTMLVRTLQ